MNLNRLKYRVRYSHTDHFGVVYYARYLDWFEAGRTEILRDNDVSYAGFEKKGLFAPVVHLEVDYHHPARYDDIVVVETSITKIGNTSVEFNYRVMRESDHLLLAEAKTVNVFVTKIGKPIKVPPEVRKILG